MKILILYFSGVGNTKMVSEKIKHHVSQFYEVDIISIEHIANPSYLCNYDAFVIGSPTYHASFAKPIIAFVKKCMPFTKPIPTFIFTTCGLYSANALRVFAKECIQKNIHPILNRSYQCIATDGVLLAPFMNVWFHHEKNLDEKILKDCYTFVKRLHSPPYHVILPRFKLYSILNYPNKLFAQHISKTIYLHKDKCTSCHACIVHCPNYAIKKNTNKFPIVDKEKCLHCYRCIHHCLNKALSLSKKQPPKKTLYF